VDTTSDVNNCGACAKACSGLAASCSSSACSTAGTLISEGAPFDIISDGVNVYWTDNFNGTVLQMLVTGGAVTTLASGRNSPAGLTADGLNVYWAEWGTAANGYTDGAVLSVPIGGTTATTLANAQNAPGYVAVDDTNIYWTNQGSAANSFTDGTVAMRPLAAGGTATTLASALLEPEVLLGSSSNGTTYDTLYWTNFGSAANTDTDGSVDTLALGTTGTQPTTVATGQAGAIGLAGGVLSDGNLYLFWTDLVGNTVEAVNATTAGSVPFEVAIGQNSPWGILLGADGLYWANSGAGTIMKVVFIGTTPATLTSGQNTPANLTGDGTTGAALFWSNEGTTGSDGSIATSAP
jgi:hypothetical protein